MSQREPATTDHLDHNERMIATCAGVALLFIREHTSNPKERTDLARRIGRSMVELVNDPQWGANALQEHQ